MTVLVLALVAVLVLPLLGLAAVVAAISLVIHAVLGITVWLVGGQLFVAALIFVGAIVCRHLLRMPSTNRPMRAV